MPTFEAASGAAADTNGNGLLQQTEFLPDINNDGTLQVTAQNTPGGPFMGFDDFDNRSITERVGNVVTGGGDFVNTGTTGSDLTDISLSGSYDPLLAAGRVYSSPGNPPPGTFPASVAPSLPPTGSPVFSNQPGFKFRFDVLKTDIDSSQDIFFNVLFGDYDVAPADLRITTNNGSNGAGDVIVLALATQPAALDGLIQASFVTLDFLDIFSDGGGLFWNGYLDVDFNGAFEPYTAFDFVELSTVPIDPNPAPVPEPGTLALFGAGLALLLLRKRRATG